MDNRLRDAERAYQAEPTMQTLEAYVSARRRTGEVSNDLDDGWDWGEVFKYAEEPTLAGNPQSVQPGFGLKDIQFVIGSDEGENDGAEWVCVVALKDGRYGYVEAGCDYTGWG